MRVALSHICSYRLMSMFYAVYPPWKTTAGVGHVDRSSIDPSKTGVYNENSW